MQLALAEDEEQRDEAMKGMMKGWFPQENLRTCISFFGGSNYCIIMLGVKLLRIQQEKTGAFTR